MVTYTYPGGPNPLTLTGATSDTIDGDGTATNSNVTVSVTGGSETLTIDDAYVTLNQTSGNGTFELNNSALILANNATPQFVVFGEGTNSLQLSVANYTNFGVNGMAVTGLEPGDGILAPPGYVISDFNYSGTTLTLSITPVGGGSTHAIPITPVTGPGGAALSPGALQISSDGTVISDGPFDGPVLCYYPGTLIRTAAGDRAVETLSVGDLVVTADGRMTSVRWIGRNTVSTRFGDPLRVLPIRIRTGAIGENLPARDLLVSPDHAVLVDDLLIQAGALVNGLSILRETNVPEIFVYYHVECAEHVLLLAEGMPTESFIDNVSRRAFDNWEEHDERDGDARIPEIDFPRAKSPRQIPSSVLDRLTARARQFSGPAAARAG